MIQTESTSGERRSYQWSHGLQMMPSLELLLRGDHPETAPGDTFVDANQRMQYLLRAMSLRVMAARDRKTIDPLSSA
jgi:hypothetical protein